MIRIDTITSIGKTRPQTFSKPILSSVRVTFLQNFEKTPFLFPLKSKVITVLQDPFYLVKTAFSSHSILFFFLEKRGPKKRLSILNCFWKGLTKKRGELRLVEGGGENNPYEPSQNVCLLIWSYYVPTYHKTKQQTNKRMNEGMICDR